jgi:hypothetical protein
MRSQARRNTIAIALVAVALCADRTTLAASSAGHHRADRTTFAGQIVRKLQVNLRRIVPAVDPLRERQSALIAPAANRPVPIIVATVPSRPPVSPFQSRLPPPGC